jgi:hypothetical protein
MVTEYFVCWGRDAGALAKSVNEAIKNGWQPLGGVAASVLWLRGDYRTVPEDQLLYQAVVKWS